MSFRNKLLIIFLVLMWISSTGVLFFDKKISEIVKQQLGERILSIVKTGALQIDGDKHAILKTRKDEATRAYSDIVKVLQNIRNANSGIRYVYTAKILKDEKMQFIVDVTEVRGSTGTRKEELVHIGDIYNEPKEKYWEFISASKGIAAANTNYVTDMWGNWISAAAPIKNSKGEIVAVLGADMSVARVLTTIKNIKKGITVIYIILTLILSLVISTSVAGKISKPIRELEKATRQIVNGNYTTKINIKTSDEVGKLAVLFNIMLKKLLDERKRLGRELHDGIEQILLINLLKLDTIIKEADSKKMQELIEISRDIRESMEDIRRIIYELRLPEIENKPLAETLLEYLKGFGKQTGIKIRSKLEIGKDLPTDKKISLSRFFTEALNNVRKHAKAKTISVTAGIFESEFLFTLEDDGTGFDIDKIDFSQHYGINSMKERIENINGKIEIESAPGKGTKIKLRIPL